MATKEDIKNVDDKLKATLRATRGNYQAQKSAIEGAIADNEKFKQSAKTITLHVLLVVI